MSTILPLFLVISIQAVIAAVAYFKDEKRSRKVNERADFKLAATPKGGGAPQFLRRSLDFVKPGDLLSFEPKLGEKVTFYQEHGLIHKTIVKLAGLCASRYGVDCRGLHMPSPSED